MGIAKSALLKVLPRRVVSAVKAYQKARRLRRAEHMSTEEVFTDIYVNNRWGGNPGSFSSGPGSTDRAVVSPYVEKVTAALARMGAASLTVVDLGCGDYSVGRLLAPLCGHYIGVDIVKPLIAHNQKNFSGDSVTFQHLDMVRDTLPDGDICFVRQVLQHLSNDEISAVLPKLDKFRWCFITEHQPSPGRPLIPNLDKVHGDGIRISRASGVFLDQPPFNIPTTRLQLLLEAPGWMPAEDKDNGIIRTYVLKGENAKAL